MMKGEQVRGWKGESVSNSLCATSKLHGSGLPSRLAVLTAAVVAGTRLRAKTPHAP